MFPHLINLVELGNSQPPPDYFWLHNSWFLTLSTTVRKGNISRTAESHEEGNGGKSRCCGGRPSFAYRAMKQYIRDLDLNTGMFMYLAGL